MRSALNGFRSIAAKELLHMRRDTATLIFAMLFPMVQLALFGFAVDFDVRHVKTVVVDLDRSRESREYTASLRNTQYLDVVGYPATPDMAESTLRRGEARAAVIIPPDFARGVGTHRGATVRVMIDGSDSQVAIAARSAFVRPSQVAEGFAQPRMTVLFNPEMRSQIYMIPGLIAVILQLVTVSLTSFSLVREREFGTLEQLMVSPVGGLGLMLGKILPYSVLAMVELVTVLAVGRVVFDVHVAGSLWALLCLSVPFVLASLSLGLLISTVAQNQSQALQMTMLTVLPAILLSGYIAPRDTMPGALYMLSNVLPATYFIQITRGVMIRGAGVYDLLPSVLALLVIAGLLLTLATVRFRKSAV